MNVVLSTDPAVWIGSLHAYNCGRLVGEWTEGGDLEQLREVADRVLAKGGGEEVALMDFQGFGEMIGEYTPLDRVAEIASAIEEHGEALIHYAAYSGFDGGEAVEDLVERFEVAYVGGGYDSLGEFAERYLEDSLVVPDQLAPYIDYEAIGANLECEGYRCIGGHVFRPA